MLEEIGVTEAPAAEEPAETEATVTEAPVEEPAATEAPVSEPTEDPNLTSDEDFNSLIDSIEKEQGVAPSSEDVKEIDVTNDDSDQSGTRGGHIKLDS